MNSVRRMAMIISVATRTQRQLIETKKGSDRNRRHQGDSTRKGFLQRRIRPRVEGADGQTESAAEIGFVLADVIEVLPQEHTQREKATELKNKQNDGNSEVVVVFGRVAVRSRMNDGQRTTAKHTIRWPERWPQRDSHFRGLGNTDTAARCW